MACLHFGEHGEVAISINNSKLGLIASYSEDRANCNRCWACFTFCYAGRYCATRPTCEQSYVNNRIYRENNVKTWQKTIINAIRAMQWRKFRWNVCGEITEDYFLSILVVCRAVKSCRFLLYTKRHDIINSHYNDLPNNLQVIFSADNNIIMDNPHNMPIAEIWQGKRKDYTANVAPACACANHMNKAITCAACGKCFRLKPGEKVIFNKD